MFYYGMLTALVAFAVWYIAIIRYSMQRDARKIEELKNLLVIEQRISNARENFAKPFLSLLLQEQSGKLTDQMRSAITSVGMFPDVVLESVENAFGSNLRNSFSPLVTAAFAIRSCEVAHHDLMANVGKAGFDTYCNAMENELARTRDLLKEVNIKYDVMCFTVDVRDAQVEHQHILLRMQYEQARKKYLEFATAVQELQKISAETGLKPVEEFTDFAGSHFQTALGAAIMEK